MQAAAATPGTVTRRPVRLDRLVTGIDFSAASLAAAIWAREHLAPAAEHILVHAITMAPMAGGTGPSRSAEQIHGGLASARARLENLEPLYSRVTIDVRAGRPEHVLAQVAAEQRANLIVVGRHSHPRQLWATAASTAEALVQRARTAVLLAHDPAQRPPRRILVPVDDSAHAAEALRWAGFFARRLDARITALHVHRPMFLNAARLVSGMHAGVRAEAEQQWQAREWIEHQLSAQGFMRGAAETVMGSGDPAAAIAAMQCADFDLIVMGSSGAGGIRRLLLGSVAAGVLRNAAVPILVVRAGEMQR